MNSTMAKIVLGNVFRTVLTAVITFFVTKNVIEADVATKLMRGDTVPLWNGAINLNMTMFVNILVGLAVPIVVPIALGIWTRVVERYKLIVARSEAFAMTKQDLKDAVKEASVADIVKTVATEQPGIGH
jgi:ornithine carbamoyltransferase